MSENETTHSGKAPRQIDEGLPRIDESPRAQTGAPERSLQRNLSTIQEGLLRNETRREIMRTLRESPGLNKNQLRRKLELFPNLLEFHLERLEEEDLVVLRPSPRGQEVLCFVAADEHLWEDEETRILFGRRSTRNVARWIAENPGTSSEETAGAVDLAKVTVQHHLRTLLDTGLVRRIRLGREVEYHPTPALDGWVSELGEAYDAPWES